MSLPYITHLKTNLPPIAEIPHTHLLTVGFRFSVTHLFLKWMCPCFFLSISKHLQPACLFHTIFLTPGKLSRNPSFCLQLNLEKNKSEHKLQLRQLAWYGQI